MSMETDFRAVMAGSASLLAIVGSNAGPKPAVGPSIYPDVYETGAANPAIRYTNAGGTIGLHMGGSDGLSEVTMQVDVRDATKAAVLAVRDALITLLHGYRGLQGETDFRLISFLVDRSSFDKPDVTGLYTATLDFSVYSRAAA